LKLFFYADGSSLGVPINVLESKKYQELKNIFNLYWTPLKVLIEGYPAVLKSWKEFAKKQELGEKVDEFVMNPDAYLRIIRIRMEKDQEAKSFFAAQMQEREMRLRWDPDKNVGVDFYKSH
jgi:hypothetical protein